MALCSTWRLVSRITLRSTNAVFSGILKMGISCCLCLSPAHSESTTSPTTSSSGSKPTRSLLDWMSPVSATPAQISCPRRCTTSTGSPPAPLVAEVPTEKCWLPQVPPKGSKLRTILRSSTGVLCHWGKTGLCSTFMKYWPYRLWLGLALSLELGLWSCESGLPLSHFFLSGEFMVTLSGERIRLPMLPLLLGCCADPLALSGITTSSASLTWSNSNEYVR